MDTEANFFDGDDEDLEMIIERQGDINEEEDDRSAGMDDEAQEVPARKKQDDKGVI